MLAKLGAARGVLALHALGALSQIALGVKWIPNVAGPFRLIPGEVEQCPPELQSKREYVRYNITARRDRRNQDIWYFSANATTFRTIDDTLTGSMKIASWRANGGWVDGAYESKIDRICMTLKKLFPSYFRRAMNFFFKDPNRDCPFPPGDYSFSNASSNLDVNVPPSYFYGKYRTTWQIWVTKTNEKVFCIRTAFTLAPKLDKRDGAHAN